VNAMNKSKRRRRRRMRNCKAAKDKPIIFYFKDNEKINKKITINIL
jgi:hypothetical protein